MNLYVEHDAAALVALGLAADPACDGVMLRHGAPDDVLASTRRANPFADDWLADVAAPGGIIVSWSGTLAAELFEPHPMTWLRPGREALSRFCESVTPQLQAAGKTITFHPHSRHVLSDPPSCLAFGREQEGPFAFTLAPGELLEPNMLPDVEDHVRRAFEMLGAHCGMVILHDVQPPETDDDGDRCVPVPLGQGCLPRAQVRALLDACVPPTMPIVLMGQQLESQLEWLNA